MVRQVELVITSMSNATFCALYIHNCILPLKEEGTSLLSVLALVNKLQEEAYDSTAAGTSKRIIYIHT